MLLLPLFTAAGLPSCAKRVVSDVTHPLPPPQLNDPAHVNCMAWRIRPGLGSAARAARLAQMHAPTLPAFILAACTRSTPRSHAHPGPICHCCFAGVQVAGEQHFPEDTHALDNGAARSRAEPGGGGCGYDRHHHRSKGGSSGSRRREHADEAGGGGASRHGRDKGQEGGGGSMRSSSHHHHREHHHRDRKRHRSSDAGGRRSAVAEGEALPLPPPPPLAPEMDLRARIEAARAQRGCVLAAACLFASGCTRACMCARMWVCT